MQRLRQQHHIHAGVVERQRSSSPRFQVMFLRAAQRECPGPRRARRPSDRRRSPCAPTAPPRSRDSPRRSRGRRRRARGAAGRGRGTTRPSCGRAPAGARRGCRGWRGGRSSRARTRTTSCRRASSAFSTVEPAASSNWVCSSGQSGPPVGRAGGGEAVIGEGALALLGHHSGVLQQPEMARHARSAPARGSRSVP